MTKHFAARALSIATRLVGQRRSRMQGPEPNRVPAMSGLNSRVVADMVRNGDAKSVPIGADYAEIVVVRHGETDWNADGRFQGILDVELNEIGRRQATAVGERLSRDGKISVIYSSDLKRAFETANLIATASGGLEVIKDPGLRERHFGDLQGLQPHVTASVFPEAYKAFQSQKTDQEIPVHFESSMHKDGSTFTDILARAICTLDEGSRALAADACDLTPGNLSSDAVKINKLRDKLERFLYLSSGGIPVVMDNQPILSQFKSLMGEFFLATRDKAQGLV